MMYVARGYGIWQLSRSNQQIIGVLLEEKRWLTIRVVTHFNRVGGVVTPDAINAVNGKIIVAANNG